MEELTIKELYDLKDFLDEHKGEIEERGEYWAFVSVNIWRDSRIYVNYVYGRTTKYGTRWKRKVTFYIDDKLNIVFDKRNSIYPNAAERNLVNKWIEEQIKNWLQ